MCILFNEEQFYIVTLVLLGNMWPKSSRDDLLYICQVAKNVKPEKELV